MAILREIEGAEIELNLHKDSDRVCVKRHVEMIKMSVCRGGAERKVLESTARLMRKAIVDSEAKAAGRFSAKKLCLV